MSVFPAFLLPLPFNHHPSSFIFLTFLLLLLLPIQSFSILCLSYNHLSHHFPSSIFSLSVTFHPFHIPRNPVPTIPLHSHSQFSISSTAIFPITFRSPSSHFQSLSILFIFLTLLSFPFLPISLPQFSISTNLFLHLPSPSHSSPSSLHLFPHSHSHLRQHSAGALGHQGTGLTGSAEGGGANHDHRCRTLPPLTRHHRQLREPDGRHRDQSYPHCHGLLPHLLGLRWVVRS